MANLFLHYAFDAWMAKVFPAVRLERYVDDVVVHCVSKRQARYVLAEITKRMTEVGLALHPEKTRIVYCQDDNRRGSTNTPISSSSATAFGDAPQKQGKERCPCRSSRRSVSRL
ncbi:reverse transcriptase domain-containing protein [Solwaraspora sp. WMMB335]|uniref:reverse transcriptase domain-containing protein n=1 Tax=Solwaraspora sp. WMMB335 TaxID=3404118 RepID=UPI003B94C110